MLIDTIIRNSASLCHHLNEEIRIKKVLLDFFNESFDKGITKFSVHFLIGIVMREVGGKANPGKVYEIIKSLNN